nr:MAG TPA_asm: hypothetical protein [Caudoviricetes sp.]
MVFNVFMNKECRLLKPRAKRFSCMLFYTIRCAFMYHLSVDSFENHTKHMAGSNEKNFIF